MFHLLPASQRPPPFDLWADQPAREKEMRPLLMGAVKPFLEFRYILDEGTTRIDSLSSIFARMLLAVASSPHGWSACEDGLELIDLMSPVLTGVAIRKMITHGVSRTARVALAANPNYPHGAAKVSPRKKDMRLFAFGTAKYGDLTKSENVDLIAEYALGASEVGSGRAPIGYLLNRDDIPRRLAEILDPLVNIEEYAVLCKMEGHRAFREKSRRHMSLDDLMGSNKAAKLPPDLTSENLTQLFTALRGHEPLLASVEAQVALHPNAPRNLFQAACQSAGTINAIMVDVARSESPHAEWFMQCQNMRREMGALRHATPEGLRWAAESLLREAPASLTNVLTHPKYPWHADNGETLKATHDLSTVLAARSLFGGSRFDHADDMINKFPGSLLFSEKLSGVQLEKLASAHPEFEALAACHPNGGEIHVEGGRDRYIADQFRAKFAEPALAGRTSVREPAVFSQSLKI